MKEFVIYVDGSYNRKMRQGGWCFLVLDKESGAILNKQYGSILDIRLNDMRNVGGEIIAALSGLEYAYQNNATHVTLCYDYIGIEKWITPYGKRWATNNSCTSYYQYIFDKKYRNKFTISFKKIKSHTGEKYNEIVDKGAKEGAKDLVLESDREALMRIEERFKL